MMEESKEPVARVESIKIILSITAYQGMAVFKVDIGSAFMRMPMVEDMKHKWVHLDKLVVKILRELQPGEYEPYVSSDGTMIMKMTKINNGLVKAAHYWYKHLKGMFDASNYESSEKDKCVYIKR